MALNVGRTSFGEPVERRERTSSAPMLPAAAVMRTCEEVAWWVSWEDPMLEASLLVVVSVMEWRGSIS